MSLVELIFSLLKALRKHPLRVCLFDISEEKADGKEARTAIWNGRGTNDSHGEDDAAPENENGGNDDTETEDEKDKAREKKSTDKKIPLKGTTNKEKPAPEEEKSLKGSTKSGRKSSKQVDKDDSSQEKGKKQTQANGSKGQGLKLFPSSAIFHLNCLLNVSFTDCGSVQEKPVRKAKENPPQKKCM